MKSIAGAPTASTRSEPRSCALTAACAICQYSWENLDIPIFNMDETTNVATNAAAPDFDMYNAMDWNDGVGTLPGSQLKFKVNEFGVLEVITEEGDEECMKKAHATTTWAVPTAQEALSESMSAAVKQAGQEGQRAHRGLVCACCQRKGSPVDFLSDGLHCSERCLQQNQLDELKLKKEVSKSNGEVVSRKKPLQQDKESVADKMDTTEVPPEGDDDDYEEKDSRKATRGAPRGRRKRRGDAALLRHTIPYGGKKKSWCWASYLEKDKAIAAPTKLFKEHQALPQSKNGFRVGMKLEGVDPEHPSMYCVLTVAEVLGHRIRLHFDKYADCYDFWVNSNSADIHPVGWCEKTGHKLHPPKGMKDEEFSWPSYIKLSKAQAAPKALFENQNTTVTPLGFRIGMKLEAIDKKNPSFICVATVTDMVDSRFLVHFDNWDESYDFWCDATSPYIHPVGWCQENNKILTTPPGYSKTFSWAKYLEETNSSPAPARAFKVKPPHSFQPLMKLEAVDKRNPMLVRVVTVVDTDDHRILVHFDGWTDEYDYWVDTDSPDIHPAGWCTKTGHPLQPPISEWLKPYQSGCPTPGCKGVGHIKGSRYSGHHSAVGCPYSDINMNKDSVLPDRLSGEIQLRHQSSGDKVTSTLLQKKIKCILKMNTNFHSLKMKVRMYVWFFSLLVCTVELTLQQALHQSVFMPCTSPSPGSAPFCWDQHSKLLPTVAGITSSKVAAWTVEEVIEFIQGLPGCKEHVRTFRDELIDGEAFLLLTQVDLVKIMSIKLGPAIKIYNSILMFKTAEESACNEL
uniref:SAM domain-containing protein n=1 Tax=Esox lucius TaxID=8010 RepID=A0A3P8YX90_ESOLU